LQAGHRLKFNKTYRHLLNSEDGQRKNGAGATQETYRVDVQQMDRPDGQIK